MVDGPAPHSGARLLSKLASLQLTAGLLALGLVLLVLHASEIALGTWLPLGVLGALTVNLAANIVHRRMWRRPPMALFHGLMLVILALAMWGRLSHYRALVPAVEGVPAALAAPGASRGPWAPPHIDALSLLVEEFDTRYWRGDALARGRTRLRLLEDGQSVLRVDVRANEPAEFRGTELYCNGGHGFAAIFSFLPLGVGAAQRGLIFFEDYRRAPQEQSQELNVPGVGSFMANLSVGELMKADGPWELVVPSDAQVTLSGGPLGQPHTLGVGSSLELASGVLTLTAIRRHGVFVVSHDPSTGWILVLVLVLPLAMFYHYAERWLRRRRKARS